MKISLLPKGKSVLDCLLDKGYFMPAFCGGQGTCGKCAVKINPATAITTEDQAFFSEAELKEGYRLACMAYPTEEVSVEFENKDKEFAVLTAYNSEDDESYESALRLVRIPKQLRSYSSFIQDLESGVTLSLSHYKKLAEINDKGLDGYLLFDSASCLRVYDHEPNFYGIAVDIGTTTLGFELVDLKSSAELKSNLDSKSDSDSKATQTLANGSSINHQRKFGADVISRILASESKLKELQESIVSDLYQGLLALCENAGISPSQVVKVALAGNTTMIHLFLGIPCQALGHTPFTPTLTSAFDCYFSEIFGVQGSNSFSPDCKISILPGVSAYVGSDITAGLLLCKKAEKETFLFIDIGTNGEMALWHQGRLICTSTAAGPAFEGGNISAGTGSVPGAISKVSYSKEQGFHFETINQLPPVGICGSGVMDLVACLVDHELIDETGVCDEDFSLTDNICFTQKDIRELQLAKAAIRAGMEVMLKEAGVRYEDCGVVYLAGGFGMHMNLNSAASIGLLPKELVPKVHLLGNAALGGCVRYLKNKKAGDECNRLSRHAEEINLSTNKEFNRLFMEYMYFE